MTAETGMLIAAGGLVSMGVLLAIVCYSLRNFTRSRLAAVCKAQGNEARLGEVLRQDETALAACEMLCLLCVTGSLLLLIPLGVGLRGGTEAAPSAGRTTFHVLVLLGFVVLLLMVVPWSISRVYGERVVYRCWPLIAVLTSLSRPLLLMAWRLDTVLHRIAGRMDPAPETVETFTDEIQSVVDEGEREGLLESRAGRMIQRIMELREDDVRTVMTPRTDLVLISQAAGWEEARRIILESGHSRIPVIGESPDDVLGLLYARDMLVQSGPREPTPSLPELVRHPNFVPETTSVSDLLERMKRERFHMAIVLDEYGGVTGVVTLEDILEEIVGDIADEFDEAEEEQIQRIDPDTTDVDARVHIDDLNEALDLEIPDEADFDTIGGFVFSEFGHIPAPGESFPWRNLRFTVLEADKRKVIKVRIQVDPTLVTAGDDA